MIKERYTSLLAAEETLDKYLEGAKTGTVGHFFTYPPIEQEDVTCGELLAIREVIESYKQKLKSIYIHWPFCVLPNKKEKCDFCCSYTTNSREERKLRNDYFQSLLEEIRQFAEGNVVTSASSIYIGGGTPLEMKEEELDELFTLMEELKLIGKNTYISIESRPELITYSKSNILAKHHVSRVSLGVESFNNDLACIMGRIERKTDYYDVVKKAVNILKSKGVIDVNVDLIYGHPCDSKDKFIESLNKAISLNLDSIAAYPLGMPSKLTLLESQIKSADQIKSLSYRKEMEKLTYEILNAAGFKRVHDCVWSKSQVDTYKYDLDSKCIGNKWNQTTVLPQGLSIGFGVSAISCIEKIAIFQNEFDILSYIEKVKKYNIGVKSCFWLSLEESCRLEIFTGIMHKKIDKKRFIQLFQYEVERLFPIEIKVLKDRKFIEEDDEVYYITDLGIPYLQAIARFFFSKHVEQRYRILEMKREDYKFYNVDYRGLE